MKLRNGIFFVKTTTSRIRNENTLSDLQQKRRKGKM